MAEEMVTRMYRRLVEVVVFMADGTYLTEIR